MADEVVRPTEIEVVTPLRQQLLGLLRDFEDAPEGADLTMLAKLGPGVIPELLDIVGRFLADVEGRSGSDRSEHTGAVDRSDLSDDDDVEWNPFWGATVAIGALRATEAVPVLIRLIRQATLDDVYEEAADALAAIGEPAVQPLLDVLNDASLDEWSRNLAGETLRDIAKQHPATRDRIVASLITSLDAIDVNDGREESRAGLLIANVTDLRAVEALPAIERLFRADAVDPTVIGPDDVFPDLGVPTPTDLVPPTVEGGPRVGATCLNCGRTRYHEVPKIYVDLGSIDREDDPDFPYSPIILPKRIICPRCGAVDRYEIEPITGAGIRLAAEIKMRDFLNRTTSPEATSVGFKNVEPMEFHAAGRKMHPLEAQAWYRDVIDRNPNDPEARIKLGNIYRLTGHLDDSMQCYQRALELDPDNAEALLMLGVHHYEAGETALGVDFATRARETYRSQIGRDRLARQQLESANAVLEDMAAGRELQIGPRRKGDLPVGKPAAPAQNRYLDDPDYVPGATFVRAGPKLGRNDPCYCGSGKKFKKCHGA